MQIVVSLALLGVSLYVILSKQYQSADTNWAYGIVGTVVGYWLKGKCLLLSPDVTPSAGLTFVPCRPVFGA